MSVRTGIVHHFSGPKGFGAILASGVDGFVFVHFSELQMAGFRTLVKGQTVAFELVNGPRGPFARNVTVAEPAQQTA